MGTASSEPVAVGSTNASGAGRDLYVLAVLALAAIALMIEFDVEEVDAAVKSLESGQLFGDVNAEVVGDLDVAALDDDLCAGRGRGLGVFNDHRAVGFHGTD